MERNLLEVENLKVYFHTSGGVVRAVDGVSFCVPRGKTIGIVGESGCGKSVMSLSILQLLSSKTASFEEGSSIKLEGEELIGMPRKHLRKIRGNRISMIFQDSMTSLNPIMTIGRQMSEPFILHQNMTKAQAKKAAAELLGNVGISEPERRLGQFPHEFSGGMRQRIMIAMALSCHPELLIADEPTTALDVTTQAQIMELMKQLKENLKTSILLISHDMGIVADMADEILVMYTGKIVEYADKRHIFKDPLHPYTQGLLASIPNIHKEEEVLPAIQGAVPNLLDMPDGCSFCDRCPYAAQICEKEKPEMYGADGRWVRCFRYRSGLQ